MRGAIIASMSHLQFDEELARAMEVLYRSGDIVRRRRLVYETLAAEPGDHLVDVGCGPGFYTLELLDQVGPHGSVAAIDVSPAMLAIASHRCEGRPNVTFHEADATSLPAEAASFDGAVCVQVLEYVADVDRALTEVHRVLRPGGRVVLWDGDWSTVSMHTTDPVRMTRVLAAFDLHLHDRSLPRTLGPRMRAAGFTDVTMTGHAFATAEFSPDAFGSSVVPLIERFVATIDDVGADEASAWAEEQRALGAGGEFYFAGVQCCFSATRP